MKSIIKLPYENPPKNQECIKDRRRGYLCRHKGEMVKNMNMDVIPVVKCYGLTVRH